MNELLDFSRVEFMPARWLQNVENGFTYSIDKELSSNMFNRFLELRSTMNSVQSNLKENLVLGSWILKEIQENKLYE